MLDSGFLVFIIAPPAYLLLFLYCWHTKASRRTTCLYAVCLLYLLAVIDVTLFPLPTDSRLIALEVEHARFHNNFIPFASIAETLRNSVSVGVILRQIVGNILLTLPLGFLLPLLSRKTASFKRVLIGGLAFTLAIESSQFVISACYGFTYKIADIDDIFLNVLGCIIGYALFRATRPVLRVAAPRLALS